MSEFRIDAGDRVNPLWIRLERHLKDRLDTVRAQNDGALDLEKTSNLRGRIAELKALLDLAQDRPIIRD